ncbi:MAG: hypothetical protein HY320_14810 [Armatimonadetes bacterium]|nr:hypothetical protein [Armatimonadota bacterium]
MPAKISAHHPLRQLFEALVESTFTREVGLHDMRVPRYIANLLVDFTHRDNLFRIRDARGRPIEEVAEMLADGDVALSATSFEREREVHKHIGDFTLFWTGVYPEMLRYFRAAARKDHLIDYVEQGRSSYRIAATFDYGPYAQEAPILRRLADEFERCIFGLNRVRSEMDALGDPQLRAVRRLLED